MALVDTYYFVPGAISVSMIGAGTSDHRALVSVMQGTKIKVSPLLLQQMAESLRYEADLSYRVWTVTGANTRFSSAYMYTASDANPYALRVPIYIYVRMDAAGSSSSAQLIFSPYEYTLGGKVFTSKNGDDLLANVLKTDVSEIYDRTISVEAVIAAQKGSAFDETTAVRSYAPANIDTDGTSYKFNYLYLRIGKIYTDDSTSIPSSNLGTDYHYEQKSDSSLDVMFKLNTDNSAIIPQLPFTILSFFKSTASVFVDNLINATIETAEQAAAWADEHGLATTASIASYVAYKLGLLDERYLRKDQDDTTEHTLTMANAVVGRKVVTGTHTDEEGNEVEDFTWEDGDLDVKNDATVEGSVITDLIHGRTETNGHKVVTVDDTLATDNVNSNESDSIRINGKVLIDRNGGIQHADFIPDILSGQKWEIDNDGNGEMESLILRSFLEVPELRYNRITVETGTTWNAAGAGVIKRIGTYKDADAEEYNATLQDGADDEEKARHAKIYSFLKNDCVGKPYFDLKLEDGEVGTFVRGDICMGVWHFQDQPIDTIEHPYTRDASGNIVYDEDGNPTGGVNYYGDNATDEEAKADTSGLTVSGFCRVEFKVTAVVDCYDSDGTFTGGRVFFNYKSGYKGEVQPQMTIVAYGHDLNFDTTDEFGDTVNYDYTARTRSWYATKKFQRYIYNMDGNTACLFRDTYGGYVRYSDLTDAQKAEMSEYDGTKRKYFVPATGGLSDESDGEPYAYFYYKADDWDISFPWNVALHLGDSTGMKVTQKDGSTVNMGDYSVFLSNVYFYGRQTQLDINQLSDNDRLLEKVNLILDLTSQTNTIHYKAERQEDGSMKYTPALTNADGDEIAYTGVKLRNGGEMWTLNKTATVQSELSENEFLMQCTAYNCGYKIEGANVYITSISEAAYTEGECYVKFSVIPYDCDMTLERYFNVRLVCDGIDGSKGAARTTADLTNDMDSFFVGTDVEYQKPASGYVQFETELRLYDGGTLIEYSDGNITYDFEAPDHVTVRKNTIRTRSAEGELSGDNDYTQDQYGHFVIIPEDGFSVTSADVTLKATYKDVTYECPFHIIAIPEGKDGQSFRLSPSLAAIQLDGDTYLNTDAGLTVDIIRGSTSGIESVVGSLAANNLYVTLVSGTTTFYDKKQDFNSTDKVKLTKGQIDASVGDGQITVSLYYGSSAATATLIDQETIPVVKNGTNATGHTADLTNEMSAVPCDKDYKPTEDRVLETVASMSYATTKIKTKVICTTSLTGTGLEVTEFYTPDGQSAASEGELGANEAEEHTIHVTAKQGSAITSCIDLTFELDSVETDDVNRGVKKYVTFTVMAVIPGANGVTPKIYDLSPSMNSIPFTRNEDGTFTLASQNLKVQVRYTEGSTTYIEDIPDGYSVYWSKSARVDQQTGNTLYTSSGIDVASSDPDVYLGLFSGDTLIDRETVPVLRDGKKGDDGQGVFTSTLFKRSSTAPDLPAGGSFAYPSPLDATSYAALTTEEKAAHNAAWSGLDGGWTDGIPADDTDQPLWMCSRTFTSDGNAPQQSAWQGPSLLADSDSLDVCYHGKTDDGNAPSTEAIENVHGTQSGEGGWHNTGTSDDYWMAVSKKATGTWGVWSVTKIKGEDGDDAVRYDLNLSALTIYRNSKGTVISPSGDLTWRVAKTKGSTTADATTDDVILWASTDGGAFAQCSLSGSLAHSSLASLSSLAFELRSVNASDASQQGDTVYATATLGSVKDGDDAAGYTADLTNEMSGAACDSSRYPSDASELKTSVSLGYGGSSLSSKIAMSPTAAALLSTYGITVTDSAETGGAAIGTTAATSHDLTFTVAKHTSGDGRSPIPSPLEVTMTLSYAGSDDTHSGRGSSTTFTIMPVLPGADGDSPVIYQLLPSSNDIKIDKTGAYNLSLLSCGITQTEGGTTSDVTSAQASAAGLSIWYNVDDAMSGGSLSWKELAYGQELSVAASGTGGISPQSHVRLELRQGGTVIDKETIPVVIDGEDGEPGADGTQANLYGYGCRLEGLAGGASTPVLHTKTGFAMHAVKTDTTNTTANTYMYVNIYYAAKKGVRYAISGTIITPTMGTGFGVGARGTAAGWQSSTMKTMPSASGDRFVAWITPTTDDVWCFVIQVIHAYDTTYSGIFEVTDLKIEDASGLTGTCTPFDGLDREDGIPQGANLIVNSAFDGTDSWTLQYGAAVQTSLYQGLPGIACTFSGSAYARFAKQKVTLAASTKYTLSWWAKGTGTLMVIVDPQDSVCPNINVVDCKATNIRTDDQVRFHTIALTSEWTYHSLTFVTGSNPGGTGYSPTVEFAATTSSALTYYISMPKLEVGDKPTAWQRNEADKQGDNGLSAYEIAGGDSKWGSEATWLASLKGASGVGQAGAMLRSRGYFSNKLQYWNTNAWVDWVMAGTTKWRVADGIYEIYYDTTNSRTYYYPAVVADDGTRSAGSLTYLSSLQVPSASASGNSIPSTGMALWTRFSDVGDYAFHLMLADSANVSDATIGEAFIGKTSAGVTVDSSGNIVVDDTANGWLIQAGKIRHTKTGLTLTADGQLYDPDGLHMKVGTTNLLADGSDMMGTTMTGSTRLYYVDTSITTGVVQTWSTSYKYGSNARSYYISTTSSFTGDDYEYYTYEIGLGDGTVYSSATAAQSHRVLLKANTTYKAYFRALVKTDVSYFAQLWMAVHLYSSQTATSGTWPGSATLNPKATLDVEEGTLIFTTGDTDLYATVQLGCDLSSKGHGKSTQVYWLDFGICEAGLLKQTGIDIEEKKIRLTADQLECVNNSGEKTMWLDEYGNLTTVGASLGLVQNIDTSSSDEALKYLLIPGETYLSDGTTQVCNAQFYTTYDTTPTVDSVYYLDVLRCGNVLNIIDCDRDIYLPFYVYKASSSLADNVSRYVRTPTRFNTGEVHMITDTELKQMVGKRIIIKTNAPSSGNAYYIFSGPKPNGADESFTELVNGEVCITSWATGWSGFQLNADGMYLLEFSYGWFVNTNAAAGDGGKWSFCYYWKQINMDCMDTEWD